MSVKICLLVLFFVVLTKAQDNNHICECDTDDDIEANMKLWGFLQKISGEVKEEERGLYAVPAGNLYQFDCSHCEEKQRKKRKIMPDVPAPVEVAKDKTVSDVPALVEVAKEKTVHDVEDVHREKKKVHKYDFRCPEGYTWFALSCVSNDEADYVNDW